MTTRAAKVGSVLGLVSWAWLASLATGCDGRRTRADECAVILDRIVELELAARGFRDPALAARTGASLRHELAPDLERCRTRPWDPAHAGCVDRSSSVDELRRHCLSQ
jgi:hypothetical protein